MIHFTRRDFNEADVKVIRLHEELLEAQKRLNDIEAEIVIANEERNFIGDWLKRNGVIVEKEE